MAAPVAVTVIENAGSEALSLPLLALMTTLPYWPTSDEEGVPVSNPVAVLKFAQNGLFWMLKPTEPPAVELALT